MKKMFLTILCAFIILKFPFAALAQTAPEKIASQAAVVMDVRTGQIIYEKNMKQQLFPASITKILTCALALLENNDNASVEMTDDSIWSVGRATTHIALTPGEIVPVKDLLNAAMIQSANDAANGLGIYVSGNLEDFAQKMTETANQLGAVDTTFKNANGLPNPQHITTAYDMALITRWALQIDGFRELFGKTIYTMPPTNLQKDERTFYKRHRMMKKNDKYYCDYVTGGKLGWTEESLHTSVTLAQKDDLELICITMKSKEASAQFKDTKTLLDYGFNSFNNVTFPKQRFSQPSIPFFKDGIEIGEISVVPQDITILKPSTVAKSDIKIELNLPTQYENTNEVNPLVKFIINDKVITEIPLDYTMTEISPQYEPITSQKTADTIPFFKPWMMFTLAGTALLIAILFIIRSFNIVKQNKRKKDKQRLQALIAVEKNIIRDNNYNKNFSDTYQKNVMKHHQ